MQEASVAVPQLHGDRPALQEPDQILDQADGGLVVRRLLEVAPEALADAEIVPFARLGAKQQAEVPEPLHLLADEAEALDREVGGGDVERLVAVLAEQMTEDVLQLGGLVVDDVRDAHRRSVSPRPLQRPDAHGC